MPRGARPELPAQLFELTDDLWSLLEAQLPTYQLPGSKGGRRRKDPRVVADAIFFVLRTGCQWKAISVARHGVSGSTAHEYFQCGTESGVFERCWEAALKVSDDRVGIEWDFQSLDGALVKAPLGGATPAPIPPIAANPAPSVRCTRTARGCRSAS